MANDRKLRERQNWRREGMFYAVKQIDARGLDDFKNEIGFKQRIKMSMDIPAEHVREANRLLQQRIYGTMRVCTMMAVRDVLKVGKVRMRRIDEKIAQYCCDLLSEDPWNQPYILFKDLAKELYDTCGIVSDDDIIDKIDQEHIDEISTERRRVDLCMLYELLNRVGMYDALELIKKNELMEFGDTLSYTQFQDLIKTQYGLDGDAV